MDDRGGLADARTVRPSTLERFRTRADELLEEALADPLLPDALRRLLIEHLESIRRAILDYEINGVSGLEKAVTLAVGMAHRERAVLEAAAHVDARQPAPAVVQRIWALTSRLARAVDWARRHPTDTVQIGLSIAQVVIGAAQFATGAPTPSPMLMLPGPATVLNTPSNVSGQIVV